MGVHQGSTLGMGLGRVVRLVAVLNLAYFGVEFGGAGALEMRRFYSSVLRKADAFVFIILGLIVVAAPLRGLLRGGGA